MSVRAGLRALFDANEVPDHVRAAYARAVRIYARRSYVTGVDIGLKVKNRSVVEEDERWYVRVHVTQKMESRRLDRRQVVQDEIDGVPTDVIEARYDPSSNGGGGNAAAEPLERIGRRQMLQPGISIGHREGGPGTLGALVTDLQSGEPCILTADHVTSPEGADGSDALVYQPGAWDAFPVPENVVARRHRRHALMGISLSRVQTDRGIDPSQFDTGIVVGEPRWPVVGDILEKSGRTTAVTRAKVLGFGKYPGCSPGVWLGLIDGAGPEEEISMGGDSGSVWYDPDTGAAVAVQCYGEPDDQLDREWALATILAYAAPELGFAM